MDARDVIIDTFSDLTCEDETNKFEPEIDWKIKCIKEKLDDGKNKDSIYFFYKEDIRKLWDGDSIGVNKNVIYYIRLLDNELDDIDSDKNEVYIKKAIFTP
jgi:hypothetical protein